MCATYYARTSDHGYETCAEHLAMAGCLAGGFAKGFGYLDDGLLAGLVHDLGKYSDAFQRRIRNPDHCGPVDHSTAGALLLMRYACPLAAMAVAGHHAGLPDFGSYGELEGPTFMSRMNRARRAGDCNPLALAQAGETQLNIPQSAFLHGTRSAKPTTSGKRSERWSLYADMMLTRMLFSALVDADRLDAEFFTSNRIDRAEHHILESLKKHLGPQNLASGRVPAFDALREASLTVSVERDAEDRSRIDRLAAIMENTADGYLAAPDKRPIDIRRCELLERCLDCGKDPSYGTGLYTLTAPTGSGKTIAPAFCSHGAEQNENAPMSKREAYEYTTALNTLLADRDRVQRIGGDTIVSWANCGDNAYRDVWDQYMGQSGGLSEKVVVDATRALAQGKPYDYEGIHLSPDEQFHILALSPNAARLSVRFYLTDTFGAFARNIDRHYRDTAIRRPVYDSTTSLPTWRLLNQTIRTQSKTAKVSPQMAGAVMKAILEDTPYPMTLINAVERRINAEHDVSPDKAAIIKAYYLRATTNAQFKEVLRMDINEENGYLPYVLGRMFSIYEQIQLAAIPDINTTIKDKYFTSASTTPARIFPILGDLAAKHMRKAWKSKGLKVKLDKALGELTGRVGDRYPSRLSLEERGAFQLGYYFENQKRFDKANKNNSEQGENND